MWYGVNINEEFLCSNYQSKSQLLTFSIIREAPYQFSLTDNRDEENTSGKGPITLAT